MGKHREGQLEVAVMKPLASEDARLAFRPEDIHLERNNPSAGATSGLQTRVEAVVPLGFFFRIELNAGVPIIAMLSRQEHQRLALRAGEPVIASFDPDHLLLLPASSFPQKDDTCV
jgi:hypothetical protein